jgi:hypothetical protein
MLTGKGSSFLSVSVSFADGSRVERGFECSGTATRPFRRVGEKPADCSRALTFRRPRADP